MFHVFPPDLHSIKIQKFQTSPLSPPPDFLGTWKIFEKFSAGSLLHDPMKEYVGNMEEYVKNM